MKQPKTPDDISQIKPQPFPTNWEITSYADNIPLGLNIYDNKTGDFLYHATFHESDNGVWYADIPEPTDVGPKKKVRHYFYFDYVKVADANSTREDFYFNAERISLGGSELLEEL